MHPHEAKHPWLSVRPMYKGKWGLAWGGADTDLEGSAGSTIGDGISFPAMRLYSAGVYFEGELAFGPAQRESGLGRGFGFGSSELKSELSKTETEMVSDKKND